MYLLFIKYLFIKSFVQCIGFLETFMYTKNDYCSDKRFDMCFLSENCVTMTPGYMYSKIF